MPLSDVTDSVTGAPQDCRIGIPKLIGRERLIEAVHSMTSRILSGEDAGTAGHTDRRRHKSTVERHAIFRQCVDMWRLDNRISVTTQRSSTLVVGQQKHDVGATTRSLTRGDNRSHHYKRDSSYKKEPQETQGSWAWVQSMDTISHCRTKMGTSIWCLHPPIIAHTV